MSTNSSPARIAANRKNALKSTGPKSPEGKARSALNGLVHGLCAQTIVLPGEDAATFEALRDALRDEFDPQTISEHCHLDTMATTRWALLRARRQETAVLTRNMIEAYAQYDAQQITPKVKPMPKQAPKPDPLDLEAVPWEDRCAVAAALVKQTPEGRKNFLDRWVFLRDRMVVMDRPTKYLDEMLLMLGHRAGELVKGVPLVEQVTLDWVSLWFTHAPANRHRVSDAIYRCTNLRGIDLEKEISRLLPKVPPYQEGHARLLALIDEQIAQLATATDPPPPADEPPSADEPELSIPIDEAAREAACSFALFDSSPEGVLRLRYMTAQDNAYNRALRGLLALLKRRGADRVEVIPEDEVNAPAAPLAPPRPTEASADGSSPPPKPSEASAEPPSGVVNRPIPVEKPVDWTPPTAPNAPDYHSRR